MNLAAYFVCSPDSGVSISVVTAPLCSSGTVGFLNKKKNTNGN